MRFPGVRGYKISGYSAYEGGKLVTGRLYSPENIPSSHFCWRLSQLKGHSVAGRIMQLKNFNDTIGNRTRDLPACSAVPR